MVSQNWKMLVILAISQILIPEACKYMQFLNKVISRKIFC